MGKSQAKRHLPGLKCGQLRLFEFQQLGNGPLKICQCIAQGRQQAYFDLQSWDGIRREDWRTALVITSER